MTENTTAVAADDIDDESPAGSLQDSSPEAASAGTSSSTSDDSPADGAPDENRSGAEVGGAVGGGGVVGGGDADGDVVGDDLNADDVDGRRSEKRRDKHELLVAEGDAAGDYLERLLDILDFDGDIDLDVEGERAVVSIIGDGDVDRLVGDRGEVLDALQELTRLAATAETGQRSRLMLDVAGYRARRRTELTDLGLSTADQVLDGGEAVKLPPMNPFERKIVHDAVATVSGVESSSEGEEPRRRVVVSPAA